MYYPDNIRQEVIDRNDIVDVVSSYVKLKRTGANLMGLCPFHSEKTPSFSVSPSKQMFYCFGCGAGGNVITFVMKYENLDFPEALRLLADRAGVTLPERNMNPGERERSSRRQLLLEANKDAAIFYYKTLYSPAGRKGLDYLRVKRGLTDETIKHFGLGFSEITDQSLSRYLKNKGYDDGVITEAGLASFDEKRGLRDKFWNRVMFPIMNRSNRVIGFGGRALGDGKPKYKYLNTSDTLIFDKSCNLYGYNFARNTRENNIILCEGYLDVISMHQYGFTQAMASLGTAFTEDHAEIIGKMKKKILLAYDSDGAGISAALRAIEILRSHKIMPYVIDLRPFKDPDEFLKNKEYGPEKFRERLDKAENGFLFVLRQSERDFDLTDPGGRTAFEKNMALLLCTLDAGAERDNYTVAAAEKYNISMDNLRSLIISAASEGIAAKTKGPVREEVNEKKNKRDPLIKQKQLLSWIASEPVVYEQISSILGPEDFEEGLMREAAEKVFKEIGTGKVNIPAMIAEYEDEESQAEIASIFGKAMEKPESKEERAKAFKEILTLVKTESYERWSKSSDTDIESVKKAMEGKRALEKLKDIRIKVE